MHEREGRESVHNPLCTTTLSIIKKYNAAAGYHTRQRCQHTPTHTPRQLTAFSSIWQPRTTSVSGSLATPLSPAPHIFGCFLLFTRSRFLQYFCTPHTRFFVTKYIIQILALGAVWLAKGPKISGRSYYLGNVTCTSFLSLSLSPAPFFFVHFCWTVLKVFFLQLFNKKHFKIYFMFACLKTFLIAKLKRHFQINF